MNKKSKRILLAALIVVAFSFFLFSACSKPFIPEKEGWSVLVTYDANGGKFNNADTTGIKTYKYKPAVNIIEPSSETGASLPEPTKEGMHVIEWYPAEVDDEGNPVKQNGQFVLRDTPWNFGEDILPEEDGFKLYLVAKWAKNYSLTIDVGEEARADGVENIVYTNFDKAGPVSVPGIEPEWAGHTFYYYYDSENNRLETSEDWSEIVLSDENPDVTVYVNWLNGVWRIVTSPEDLEIIVPNANYLLDADIDFMDYKTEKPGKLNIAKNYNGTFEGNGHAIKNFKASYRQGGPSDINIGLFSFGTKGILRNVRFENASFDVELTAKVAFPYNVGFFCGNGSKLDLSAFTGLVFKDCKLNIVKSAAAQSSEVLIGSGTYEGIFGYLSEEQAYAPDKQSNAVEITIG